MSHSVSDFYTRTSSVIFIRPESEYQKVTGQNSQAKPHTRNPQGETRRRNSQAKVEGETHRKNSQAKLTGESWWEN
jgi:hypothetical protein